MHQIGVRAGTGPTVAAQIAALGVPAHAVAIREEQPARTGGEPGSEDGPLLHFRLLASEKRLPPWEAMEREDTVIRLADGQEQFEQLWSFFQLDQPPVVKPKIDWQTEAVLFVGLGESGSCPLQLAGFTVRTTLKAEPLLQVHTAYDGEFYICTADYTPRTFVAAVPKASLPAGSLGATIKSRYSEPVVKLR